MYGTTYRFQEEDAADGTSFAPADQGISTRQFPSSKTSQVQQMRARKCTNTINEEDITVIFASRLFQIGDDQWPHIDDVGYNIHKMTHTQVIGQDGLIQSGARGHPVACLSAF